MRSLVGRVKRLQVRCSGVRGNCPVCGKPLDHSRSWQQNLEPRVIYCGDPEPPQCPACGTPRILRITFEQ